MNFRGLGSGLLTVGAVVLSFVAGWLANGATASSSSRAIFTPRDYSYAPRFTPVSHIAGAPVSAVAMESLAEALDQKIVELDLHAAPLSEAVAMFSEKLQRPILFDTEEVERLKIKTDTPVTIKLRNHQAASALRLALRPLGLTYDLREDAVVITALDAIESSAVTKVYPIEDMVSGWSNWSIDEVVVTRAIKTSLPRTPPPTAAEMRVTGYDQLTSPATPRLSIFGDAVVLRGSMRHHEHVAQLLRELRALRASGLSTASAVAMVAKASPQPSSAPTPEQKNVTPAKLPATKSLDSKPLDTKALAKSPSPAMEQTTPPASFAVELAPSSTAFVSAPAPPKTTMKSPQAKPVKPLRSQEPAATQSTRNSVARIEAPRATPPVISATIPSKEPEPKLWTTSMPWLLRDGVESRCRLELSPEPVAEPRAIDLRQESEKRPSNGSLLPLANAMAPLFLDSSPGEALTRMLEPQPSPAAVRNVRFTPPTSPR